jgi:hypothetical protein
MIADPPRMQVNFNPNSNRFDAQQGASKNSEHFDANNVLIAWKAVYRSSYCNKSANMKGLLTGYSRFFLCY